MAVINGANQPDFFIVGAPKCGTTSLHYYLHQHPQVYMAAKELHFFGQDFTYVDAPTPLTYYLSFFKDALATQLIGEASVWYLYSKRAAEEIKQMNPEAKIIVMLRNPTDMIYSLHAEQCYNGNEDINSFEAALKAETTRLKGKLIPPNIGCPLQALQYRQVGLYYEQVNRYIEVFGKPKVHCIFLSDLKNDIEQCFKKVLHFLQLNEDVKIDYRIQNKHKIARNKAFTTLLRNRSKKWIQMVKFIIPNRKWRLALQDKLWKLNAKTTEQPEMSASLRNELKDWFLPDIEKLEVLLDRDLADWK